MQHNKKISGFDGMRGLAALLIVAFHVAVMGSHTGHNFLFDRTIGRGDCFVRMFFMLSSFSLMNRYFKSFLDGSFSVHRFLSKRASRVFPCFWFAMVLHFVLNAVAGITNTVSELIGTGSLLFSLMPSHQDSMVWAGWSMSVQMVFYLVFPVFLVFCRTKKSTCITFIASILLLWSYMVFYSEGVMSPHINIIRQFIFFVGGALLFHYSSFFENLTSQKKSFWVIICILLDVAAFFLFPKLNEDGIMFVAFSAWMLLQIMNVDFICRIRPLKWLGSISYEIYLFHCVLFRLVFSNS